MTPIIFTEIRQVSLNNINQPSFALSLYLPSTINIYQPNLPPSPAPLRHPRLHLLRPLPRCHLPPNEEELKALGQYILECLRKRKEDLDAP